MKTWNFHTVWAVSTRLASFPLGCGLTAAVLLALASARLTANPGGDYLQFIPLLMFAEAFLNGMVMTSLIACKPCRVATFYDEWYLDGK